MGEKMKSLPGCLCPLKDVRWRRKEGKGSRRLEGIQEVKVSFGRAEKCPTIYQVKDQGQVT